MAETDQARSIRRIVEELINDNFILKNLLVSMRLYDKVVLYVPEIVLIVSNDARGREILEELGIRYNHESTQQ